MTAANSSGINDLRGGPYCYEQRKKPMSWESDLWQCGRGGSLAGVDPSDMGIGPVAATKKIMEKTGFEIGDFDLIEANEAFAHSLWQLPENWESRIN